MALTSRRALATLVVAGLMLTSVAACSKKTTAPQIGAPAPFTPQEVVEAVLQAWIDRDTLALRTLLGVGFAYQGFCVDTALNVFPIGSYFYDEELATTARIFHFGYGGRPPVSAVSLDFADSVRAQSGPPPDPYERGFTAHVTGTVHSGGDTLRMDGLHVFTVLRADHPLFPIPGDSTHWILREWYEGPPNLPPDCDPASRQLLGYVRALYSP